MNKAHRALLLRLRRGDVGDPAPLRS